MSLHIRKKDDHLHRMDHNSTVASLVTNMRAGHEIGACKTKYVVNRGKQCYLTAKLPNGTKQYKCTVCGEMFSSQSTMVSHKQRHGTQETKTMLSDMSVEREDAPNNSEDISMASMAPEETECFTSTLPIACNSTGVGTSGLPSIKCTLCDESFSQKAELNRHIPKVHFSKILSKSVLTTKAFAQRVNCTKTQSMNDNCEEDSATSGHCSTSSEIKQVESCPMDQGTIEGMEHECDTIISRSVGEKGESEYFSDVQAQVNECARMQHERKLYSESGHQDKIHGNMNLQPQEATYKNVLGEDMHCGKPSQQEHHFADSPERFLSDEGHMETLSHFQDHSEGYDTNHNQDGVNCHIQVKSEPGVDLQNGSEKKLLSEFPPNGHRNLSQCTHQSKLSIKVQSPSGEESQLESSMHSQRILGELVYVTSNQESHANQPADTLENSSPSSKCHANNCNRAYPQMANCPELADKLQRSAKSDDLSELEDEQQNRNTFHKAKHQSNVSHTRYGQAKADSEKIQEGVYKDGVGEIFPAVKTENALRERFNFPMEEAKNEIPNEENIRDAPENKKCICQLCDEPFTEQIDLFTHDCLILKEYRQCAICHKRYSNVASCSRHYRTIHLGYTPFKCDKCKRAFFQQRTLESHQKKTHEKLSFRESSSETGRYAETTNINDLKANTNEGRKHEKASHIRLPHQCHICSKEFPLRFHLIRHYESCHVEQKSFECPKCHEAFQSQQTMLEHEETVHEEKLDSISSGNARTQSEVADSQRNNTVVNRKTIFECNICSVSFRKNAAFVRHQRYVHNILRPHKCPVCLKAFSLKGNRDSHHRAVHLQLKPFKCQKCGKEFARKQHLMEKHRCVADRMQGAQNIPTAKGLRSLTKSARSENHANFKGSDRLPPKFHASLKRFTCPVCNKSFASKQYRDQHLNTLHSQFKYFRCKTCSKSFSSHKDLVQHEHFSVCHKAVRLETNCEQPQQKIHQKNPSHECHLCHKAFADRQILEHHQCNFHKGDLAMENGPVRRCSVPRKMDSVYNATVSRGETDTNSDQEVEDYAEDNNRAEKVSLKLKFYICPVCDRTYKDPQSLKSHQLRRHSSSKAKRQVEDTATGKPKSNANEFINNNNPSVEIEKPTEIKNLPITETDTEMARDAKIDLALHRSEREGSSSQENLKMVQVEKDVDDIKMVNDIPSTEDTVIISDDDDDDTDDVILVDGKGTWTSSSGDQHNQGNKTPPFDRTQKDISLPKSFAYECNLCKKKFKSSMGIVKHIKAHMTERAQ